MALFMSNLISLQYHAGLYKTATATCTHPQNRQQEQATLHQLIHIKGGCQ